MRSSVAIPPAAALRPRLPHAKTVALVAAQLAFVGVLLWFCLPQALGGRAGWVLVSGTSMLPRLHTGDLVLVERGDLPGGLWSGVRGWGRRRGVVLVTAGVGLVARFVGTLASGSSGPSGRIMFVPWVALYATQLGPVAGGLAGAAATAIYCV